MASASPRHRRTTALRLLMATLCCAMTISMTIAIGDAHAQRGDNTRTVTMTMRDVSLSEVMEMLARAQRINILLGDDVDAEVSFTLYDVPLPEAIESIADAAGYAVDQRDGTYFVIERGDVNTYSASGMTEVRTFRIQYADPATVQSALEPYLSEYGRITSLPDKRLLMVEDRPRFMRRLASLIAEIDRTPRQILIEAKILEVTLDDEDSYGVDWTDFFFPGDGQGTAGTRGLSDAGTSGTQGAFVSVANGEFTLMLSALESEGRVRTLSTPKLLALENEASSVIVGDRRGYPVTTTINQVTTETIEFLESGVILDVTPYVDVNGRIMMQIHPEVSNGVIDSSGIPSQTTTEVTTKLLVESGQTIFIGGLIKHTQTEVRSGVPVLRRIPGVGGLFSGREQTNVNTETIVLITPSIVSGHSGAFSDDVERRVDDATRSLRDEASRIEEDVDLR